MFVVSLIIDGELKKTLVRSDPDDAVKIAHAWLKAYKGQSEFKSYIAIDEQNAMTDSESTRYAEIQFEENPEKMNLFLKDHGTNDLMQKASPILKKVVFSLMEFGMMHLGEYLNGQKKLLQTKHKK